MLWYQKKAFGGCKSKKLLLDIRLLDVKTELVTDVAWGSEWFWLFKIWGHSANQEVPKVSLQGSWMLCTPFLMQQQKILFSKFFNRKQKDSWGDFNITVVELRRLNKTTF